LINNLVSILNSNVRYWLLTAINWLQKDGGFTPKSGHGKFRYNRSGLIMRLDAISQSHAPAHHKTSTTRPSKN